MPTTNALRAVDFTPRTVNESRRTVELIASTGAAVPRRDIEGEYFEVLSLDGNAVDLSLVAGSGVPLLNAHRRDSVEDQLGVARAARVENGQLIVTVEFSERSNTAAIFRDVAAGIIRNVSIGYSVDRFEDQVVNGQRVRLAVRWTLKEVSLVPLGADPGAKTRGANMPEPTTIAPTLPAPPPAPPAPMTRAAVNQEIRALVETFNLGTDLANDLIDRGVSVDEARASVIDALRKKPTAAGNPPHARVAVIANNDDPAQLVSRMGEALYLRANPAHKLSDPARPYANMTTLDMARQVLQLRGQYVATTSPAETITRALHTTSDFPLIFADTANRVLRAAYEAAPAVLKRLARQTTAKDFRAKTALQVSGTPSLEKVNEHGEYKYGSMTEGGESYKIDTFGKIIGLSRQAIINDDVGAFTDLAGKFGISASEFEAQALVDLLASGAGNGPTMRDTKALFHTDHGNKAASAGAPDETRLSAARLAMRKQTGLDTRPINVAPRFMLVPPELETSSEKLLATLQPTKTEDVNPFGGKFELLVEARLPSATRWYVVGDPARIEGLEYAYLLGQEGPQIETRAGFDVDGLETKCRLDFGAAFLEWRAWFMNAGA